MVLTALLEVVIDVAVAVTIEVPVPLKPDPALVGAAPGIGRRGGLRLPRVLISASGVKLSPGPTPLPEPAALGSRTGLSIGATVGGNGIPVFAVGRTRLS